MTIDEDKWARSLVGRELKGRYRLAQLLGMGGMGAVFAAEHLAVGRRVAVKMLLPDLAADQQTVRRFHQEARSAAAVGGRGVVDILDYDIDPTTGPYLVMEMLEGEPLSRRIERAGRFEPGDVMWVADSILRTLEKVHAQGIVHRDLKPDNVYICRDEHAEIIKILDFGISRVMTNEPAKDSAFLTRPGVVLGTPTYMAPEQARGDPDVDHRVDIYAVGAMLFECCTGRPPHVGGNWQQVFAMVLTSPPPPLRSLRPGLPDPLYRTIDRALARERDERFPDAGSMLAALSSVGEPLPRTRSPAGQPGAVPATRIGPATPVGNAWGPSTRGTPYAVSAASEPRTRPGRGGCLLAAGLGVGLLVATAAAGVGFYLLRDRGDGGTGPVAGGGPTALPDAGVAFAPVDPADPDAGGTVRGASASVDAGASPDEPPSAGGTKLAGGSSPTGRDRPRTGMGTAPVSPPDDPPDDHTTTTTTTTTTTSNTPTTTGPTTGGTAEATLRARLDAANAHRRAGRAREAIRGYEDVIHLAWTGQIPSGSAGARHAAEARMALGDIYSARIRPLPRAPTPDEFSEGWRRVTNTYSQAAQEYGRVGMYGHTDLTVCSLVRTGRASERLADVTKNIEAPQSIVDLGQEHADRFTEGFQSSARSYLESARGVYEAAMNIPSSSPCRTEAMDSMQRVLRALGRRNP